MLFKQLSNPWTSVEDIGFIESVVQGTVNSPREQFSFLYQGRGVSALKRSFGCNIIWNMPEEGIEEAVTKLIDIFMFTAESSKLKITPPQEVQKGTGKIKKASEMPELVITE